MSKSTFLASQGTLTVVLDPLKQMRADLNRASDGLCILRPFLQCYQFCKGDCGASNILGQFRRLL